MPLQLNSLTIDRISGPVYMSILTPIPIRRQTTVPNLFPNLPIFILFGDKHRSNENVCKQTDKNTYSIYDINFLKEISNLATQYGRPIDFYVEGGDFHNRTQTKPNTDNFPLQNIWNLYNECYSKKKLVQYEHKTDCKNIENIRWQSGDIRLLSGEKHRKAFLNCNLERFLNLLTKYSNTQDLSREIFIKIIESFNDNPFNQDINRQLKPKQNYNCLAKLYSELINIKTIYENDAITEIQTKVYSKNGLIFKQLNKFSSEKQKQKMEEHINYYCKKRYNSVLERKGFKEYLEQLNKCQLNLVSLIKTYIETRVVDEKLLTYLNSNKSLLTRYYTFVISKYSFISDLYTVCRIFKYLKSSDQDKSKQPIMNICYFGYEHIQNIEYFLTYISNLYDSRIISPYEIKEKEPNRCLEIKQLIIISDLLKQLITSH